MSTTARAAKRSVKTAKEPTVAKQNSKKTEPVKNAVKNKKQSSDQITGKSTASRNDIGVDRREVRKVMECTEKGEELVITALQICEDVDQAVEYLLGDDYISDWITPADKKKKKKEKKGPEVAGSGDTNCNEGKEEFEYFDKDAGAVTGAQNNFQRGGIRRGGGGGRGTTRGRVLGRQNDRSGLRWQGRDRFGENGPGNDAGVRDGYRGRGRLVNGQPRGRGVRGGRGGSRLGPRTYQNRDNRDRDTGFPNQIDTWANPDTTDGVAEKIDEFPSPEDWDNEEYTGSLADTKVFTPSAVQEVEQRVDTTIVIASATFVPSENAANTTELSASYKEESSLSMSMTVQPSQPTMQNMVVGSNQLTPEQTQYFNQLTAQASENRKQAALQQQQQQQPPQQGPIPLSKIVQQQKPATGQQQQSSMIFIPTLNAASQPYTSPSSHPPAAYSSIPPHSQTSQSFASIAMSQPSYATSAAADNAYQHTPPPPATIGISYNGGTMEFTSSNYSDIVSNYNTSHVLPNNGPMPNRSKPSAHSSQSTTPSKVPPSGPVNDVEMAPSEGSINAAIKLLDQFGTLEFTRTDVYNSSADTSIPPDPAIAALSAKFSVPVGPSTTKLSELSVNNFQAVQQTQSRRSTTPEVQSVLTQNTQQAVGSNDLTNESANMYPGQTGSVSMKDQKSEEDTGVSNLQYDVGASNKSSYQKVEQSTGPYHQPSISTPNYSSASYGQPSQVTNSEGAYSTGSNQPQNFNAPGTSADSGPGGVTGISSFSVYGAGAGGGSNSGGITVPVNSTLPPTHHGVYQQNTAYQQQQQQQLPVSLPAVTSFQSYLSAPAYLPSYQVSTPCITQAAFMGNQYGTPTLASIGAAYGIPPFANSFNVTSSIQSPIVTIAQTTHKMASASLGTTVVSSKEPQFDNVNSSMSSATSNTLPPSVASVVSSVASLTLSSHAPAASVVTTSTKITSSASAGNKLSIGGSGTGGGGAGTGMLPNMLPGITPVVGPQYIMSQGTMPIYQPPFMNYDELYMPRGIAPHVPQGYVDVNYHGPQANIPTGGRDGLNVPFSSISDAARYTRPDNTTSPVPPPTGASLPQQSAGPTHQQPLLNPLLQTYAAAYIYPYQQYTTPVYQVTPSPSAGHGSSSNPLGNAPFAKGGPGGGYNTGGGFGSQYESLNVNQSGIPDFGSGGSSVGKSGSGGGPPGYSGSQGQQSKSGPVAGSSGIQGPGGSATDLAGNVYGPGGKQMGGKPYDKQQFHGAPAPFAMPGSGTVGIGALGGAGNPSGAQGQYAPPLFIPSIPPNANAPGSHPHLLHQAQQQQHQDNTDMRNTGMGDRNFFIGGTRPVYR